MPSLASSYNAIADALAEHGSFRSMTAEEQHNLMARLTFGKPVTPLHDRLLARKIVNVVRSLELAKLAKDEPVEASTSQTEESSSSIADAKPAESEYKLSFPQEKHRTLHIGGGHQRKAAAAAATPPTSTSGEPPSSGHSQYHQRKAAAAAAAAAASPSVSLSSSALPSNLTPEFSKSSTQPQPKRQPPSFLTHAPNQYLPPADRRGPVPTWSNEVHKKITSPPGELVATWVYAAKQKLSSGWTSWLGGGGSESAASASASASSAIAVVVHLLGTMRKAQTFDHVSASEVGDVYALTSGYPEPWSPINDRHCLGPISKARTAEYLGTVNNTVVHRNLHAAAQNLGPAACVVGKCSAHSACSRRQMLRTLRML